jgi:zinc/manganese transport system permease protein
MPQNYACAEKDSIRLTRNRSQVPQYWLGAVSYFIGIAVSVLLDLPTGAVIVWSMAAIALLAGTMISDKRSID